MKEIQYKFSLLFLFSFSMFHAQNMYVRPKLGVQTVYSLANIDKLTFSFDYSYTPGERVMVVTPINGNVVSHPLFENRYINFTDLSLTIPEYNIDKIANYLYPNPVKDILYISMSLQNKAIDTIEIISLDGRLTLQQITPSQPQIDVSAIPTGLYLCKITSGGTNQIIKFLKQ